MTYFTEIPSLRPKRYGAVTSIFGRNAAFTFSNMRVIILIASIFLASIRLSPAQDALPGDHVGPNYAFPALGFQAGYQANLHNADFNELPGTPSCCPKYESGNGGGISLGGFYQFPLSDRFALQLRGVFSILNGTLLTQEHTSTADNQNISTDAVIEHTIESSLSILSIEPVALFYPFERPVSFRLGTNIGFMVANSFEQNEVIIEPEFVVFKDNGLTDRNQASGEIPDIQSLYAGIYAGVGYDLPIGKAMRLTPEISYVQSITNVVKGLSWGVNTLRFSAAISYPLLPPPPPPPDPEPEILIPDPPVVSKPVEPVLPELNVDMDFLDIRNVDGEMDFALVIEETEFRETLPLLPNVFFEEGSHDMSRTRLIQLTPRETRDFHESDLPTQAIEFYQNTLNIIGKRMRENPDATLDLTGLINTFGKEVDDPQLASKRATIVRDYLVTTWEIAPERIRTRTRRSTIAPDLLSHPDIRQENQTVLISSNSYEVMKPVLIQKNYRQLSIDKLSMAPNVQSEAGIKNWQLYIEQDERVLATFAGKEDIGTVLWEMNPEDFSEREVPLKFSFNVTDNTGQFKTMSKELPVSMLTVDDKRKENQADKRIEKFSLILFGFDKNTLDSRNRRILNEVADRIEPESSVAILGYADRTGTTDYNKSLAETRCREVLGYLTKKVPRSRISIQPVGSDKLLYDNDIPEGRSYSRTVQIIIETPIKR